MSTPNAAGVAALVLSARRELVGRPAALVRRLTDTASHAPVNFMGPNDPVNTAPALTALRARPASATSTSTHPIGFADAYGAGLVDAAAAVGR